MGIFRVTLMALGLLSSTSFAASNDRRIVTCEYFSFASDPWELGLVLEPGALEDFEVGQGAITYREAVNWGPASDLDCMDVIRTAEDRISARTFYFKGEGLKLDPDAKSCEAVSGTVTERNEKRVETTPGQAAVVSKSTDPAFSKESKIYLSLPGDTRDGKEICSAFMPH
jgi:hypothetical protein